MARQNTENGNPLKPWGEPGSEISGVPLPTQPQPGEVWSTTHRLPSAEQGRAIADGDYDGPKGRGTWIRRPNGHR
ncbi:MAG TPA: hypothetical protein VLB73_04680 [Patescibacteria group bacterium]|nr:hypothetical protein [Patescibacteria group bacterium]